MKKKKGGVGLNLSKRRDDDEPMIILEGEDPELLIGGPPFVSTVFLRLSRTPTSARHSNSGT